MLLHLPGQLAGDLDRAHLRAEGTAEGAFDEAGDLALEASEHTHGWRLRAPIHATRVTPARWLLRQRLSGRRRKRDDRADDRAEHRGGGHTGAASVTDERATVAVADTSDRGPDGDQHGATASDRPPRTSHGSTTAASAHTSAAASTPSGAHERRQHVIDGRLAASASRPTRRASPGQPARVEVCSAIADGESQPDPADRAQRRPAPGRGGARAATRARRRRGRAAPSAGAPAASGHVVAAAGHAGTPAAAPRDAITSAAPGRARRPASSRRSASVSATQPRRGSSRDRQRRRTARRPPAGTRRGRERVRRPARRPRAAAAAAASARGPARRSVGPAPCRRSMLQARRGRRDRRSRASPASPRPGGRATGARRAPVAPRAAVGRSRGARRVRRPPATTPGLVADLVRATRRAPAQLAQRAALARAGAQREIDPLPELPRQVAPLAAQRRQMRAQPPGSLRGRARARDRVDAGERLVDAPAPASRGRRGSAPRAPSACSGAM